MGRLAVTGCSRVGWTRAATRQTNGVVSWESADVFFEQAGPVAESVLDLDTVERIATIYNWHAGESKRSVRRKQPNSK